LIARVSKASHASGKDHCNFSPSRKPGKPMALQGDKHFAGKSARATPTKRKRAALSRGPWHF
jgi:hypothetical protein